eukprot:s3045_g3.t1
MPFPDACDALGVSFNLSMSFRGFATICNTETRILELCAELQLVIQEGSLTSKDAQRLRGRMQFADAQLFGRTGKRCLRVLSDFAEGRRQRLGDKDHFVLKLFAQLLWKNVPREVRSLGRNNVVIFTDACYERDSAVWPCGIGGVLFFEEKVSVLFVDYEGSKFSLMRGISDNATVDTLAEFCAELESEVHAFVWLSRVPSKSNIADPPSRGDVSHALFQSVLNVSAAARSISDGLVTRLEESGVKGCETSHFGKRRACSDSVPV